MGALVAPIFYAHGVLVFDLSSYKL